MLYADTLKIFESLRGSFDEKEAKSIATAINILRGRWCRQCLEGIKTTPIFYKIVSVGILIYGLIHGILLTVGDNI